MTLTTWKTLQETIPSPRIFPSTANIMKCNNNEHPYSPSAGDINVAARGESGRSTLLKIVVTERGPSALGLDCLRQQKKWSLITTTFSFSAKTGLTIDFCNNSEFSRLKHPHQTEDVSIRTHKAQLHGLHHGERYRGLIYALRATLSLEMASALVSIVLRFFKTRPP